MVLCYGSSSKLIHCAREYFGLLQIDPVWEIWTEAEAPILWLPNAKSWFIGKDPDAGKDLRAREGGSRG